MKLEALLKELNIKLDTALIEAGKQVASTRELRTSSDGNQMSLVIIDAAGHAKAQQYVRALNTWIIAVREWDVNEFRYQLVNNADVQTLVFGQWN